MSYRKNIKGWKEKKRGGANLRERKEWRVREWEMRERRALVVSNTSTLVVTKNEPSATTFSFSLLLLFLFFYYFLLRVRNNIFLIILFITTSIKKLYENKILLKIIFKKKTLTHTYSTLCDVSTIRIHAKCIHTPSLRFVQRDFFLFFLQSKWDDCVLVLHN